MNYFDVLIVITDRFDDTKYGLWTVNADDEGMAAVACDVECVAKTKLTGRCWQVLAVRRAGEFGKIWGKLQEKGMVV